MTGAPVRLGRATEKTIMEGLEADDPDLVEQIRRLMFVFEDLGKLDPGGIQTLLRAVEKDQLALCVFYCLARSSIAKVN